MSEVNHSKHGLLVLVHCVIRLILLRSNLLLYVSTSLDIANFAMLYMMPTDLSNETTF